MSGLAIKWWMTILGFFSFICVTDWWTSEGYLRENKKVVLKSNVVKRVFGFSEWVTEVDRSSIILNIKNEIVLIFLIVGWFVIDADKKEYFIDKFCMRGIFIAIMIVEGLIWPMIIEWQMGKEEKPVVHMRETFDLCQQEGEITSYDDEKCIYKYVYTYSKKEDMPNKVVIFPPHAYSELMDVDGNGYTWNSKGEYKMLTNKGAYQELSDALVRAGYITLRLEAKRQLGLYKANAKMLSGLFLRILEQ